ncbi:MAG: hypothetical protein AAF489_01170 [Bacteroidota bacterium]
MFKLLASSHTETYTIVIIAAIIVVVALFIYYFSTKQVIIRTLKKSPAQPIARVQNKEYAKIIGQAKHVKDPLQAPVSGRQCIFYQIVVEKKGSKNSWHRVIDETRTQDFFIESQGEMAIVKMDQPKNFQKIYLDKDHSTSIGFLQGNDPKLESFLKSRNYKSTNFLGFSKTLRYKEGIIGLNEKIAVMGVAQWKSLNQPIEGYNYSKILTLSGNENQKLLITDIKKLTKENK